MTGSLPLEGVLVVAVEQAVAAPFATRQLADLGARVVKVERPDGGDFARHYDHLVGGVSAYFAWLNRGKESVALDLKDAADRALLERALARADVFVQNLSPRAAAALGVDADAVHARHPHLIAADLTGFGAGSPRRAYDLLVQAEAGVLAVTGTPEEPAKAGISIADIAGGMYLLTGILAALVERGRTGAGTALRTSLFEGLTEWMTQPWYLARYGSPPARTGAAHATIAPYGPFRCGDGESVVLGIQNEREWVRFCEQVLDAPEITRHPDFATNVARVEHRAALTERIESAFVALDRATVIARLDAADIAYAVERSPAALASLGEDRMTPVGAPDGKVEALAPPITFAGRELAMGPIPGLGQHTQAFRDWLADDA